MPCSAASAPRRCKTAALNAVFGSRKLRDGPGAYTMAGFHDMGFAAFGEVRGRVFRTAPVLLPRRLSSRAARRRPRDAAGGQAP